MKAISRRRATGPATGRPRRSSSQQRARVLWHRRRRRKSRRQRLLEPVGERAIACVPAVECQRLRSALSLLQPGENRHIGPAPNSTPGPSPAPEPAPAPIRPRTGPGPEPTNATTAPIRPPGRALVRNRPVAAASRPESDPRAGPWSESEPGRRIRVRGRAPTRIGITGTGPTTGTTTGITTATTITGTIAETTAGIAFGIITATMAAATAADMAAAPRPHGRRIRNGGSHRRAVVLGLYRAYNNPYCSPLPWPSATRRSITRNRSCWPRRPSRRHRRPPPPAAGAATSINAPTPTDQAMELLDAARAAFAPGRLQRGAGRVRPGHRPAAQ